MMPCPWCSRVWSSLPGAVLEACSCGYYEGAKRRPKGSGKSSAERAVEYRKRQHQALK